MWSVLEENWNHFFWLTGEIPPTLNDAVNDVSAIVTCRKSGKQNVLSLRNQVWMELLKNVKRTLH